MIDARKKRALDLKVAFDHQAFLLQEYGGISRYICSLANKLSLLPSVQVEVVAPLHFNQNLAALKNVAGVRRLLPKVNTKLFRPVALASKHLARRSINRFKPDILHETYYSPDNYRPNSARLVLTVYDMIHERYPDLFVNRDGTTQPKKKAVTRADHVICISESTRRDVVQYFGVPEERTSVVYLGVDEGFMQTVAPPRRYHPRPFLLYVGARGGYKNFNRALRAFASSARLRQEFDVVCFGGGPLVGAERELVAALGLRADQLIQMGGEDETLAALYHQAEALIYPSICEGFGIPPLEAMASGCPVISSQSSSLPEVVGDAAETFDPLNEEAILAALENVLDSPSRRTALIELGRARYPLFTWTKCAEETEAIYRRLL